MRIYLNVYYTYRKIAKDAGAKWDHEKKLWYIDYSGDVDQVIYLMDFVRDRNTIPDSVLLEVDLRKNASRIEKEKEYDFSIINDMDSQAKTHFREL